MDFIIPDKINPRIIVESSFLVTTSSGQGDKSKTEISFNNFNKKYLGLFDVEKKEEKVPIGEINEIYQYAERIIATVSNYEKAKKVE